MKIKGHGTGIDQTTARGRSTDENFSPADHSPPSPVGAFIPHLYSESDCRLFVQALRRLSNMEAKSLVTRMGLNG